LPWLSPQPIAVSATAIAAILWLIVVFLLCCLCFRLPLPLPAPTIAAVVCQRHCHCCRCRNQCPGGPFRRHRCHHRHCCLFFCCWLRCLYVSTTAASVSVTAAHYCICFHRRHATASLSDAIATVVSAMATITDEKR
jgi:hypothetical protein